jgi:hypothetical protein
MKTFMNWFFIVTSPLVAMGVWSTDNIGFLRFLSSLFFISIILEAINDLYEARVKRRSAKP